MERPKYLPRSPAPSSFWWRLAARFAIAAIVAYQKHLSPRKGFRCAHRALHGGASCSEFVKQAIAAHGLRDAVWLARARFGECKAAAWQMSAARMQVGALQDDRGERKRWYDPWDILNCSCEAMDCTPDCSGPDCGG